MHLITFLQVIMVPEKGEELPEGVEARDGVTPPMRNAQRRRFRRDPSVAPAVMKEVEDAVMKIISVGVLSPAMSEPNLCTWDVHGKTPPFLIAVHYQTYLWELFPSETAASRGPTLLSGIIF